MSVLPGNFVISALSPPEPLLSSELCRLVKEFAEMHRMWADPKEALNMCYNASLEFNTFLKENGLDERHEVIDLTLTNEKDRVVAPEWYPHVTGESMLSQGHVVNFVDGIIIDWTIRQYNHDAPFPLVFIPKKKVDLTHFIT